MNIKVVFPFILTVSVIAQTPNGSYTIRPLIGSGSKGDGGPATSALLDGPYGLARDPKGNVYISESNAGTIRQVRPDGTIQRFAGTGILNDGAQGHAAIATDLTAPGSLLVDKDGGLIFADTGACRIRKVMTSGIIHDLVGTGRCAGTRGGFPGGGGGATSENPPLQTDIGEVAGLALDASGRLVFSDTTSQVVRRLDSDGIVRVIAGVGAPGFSGDESAAVSAALNTPRGLTVDSDGNVYIADSHNCRVRAIATDGTINTVAGNSNCANGTSESLGYLNGLAYDSENNSILIVSTGQDKVLRYDVSAKSLESLAGSGSTGAADSASAGQYPFDSPADIAVSGSTVLVADNTAFRVLQVQSGNVSAFAGSWPQVATYSSASTARLLRPAGLCFRSDGSLLAIDTDSGQILAFSQPDQLVPFAGARYPTGHSDGDGGPAVLAPLTQPRRLACGSNGMVYVTDGTEIRQIDRQGNINLVIGAICIEETCSYLVQPTGIVHQTNAVIYSEPTLNEVIRFDLTTHTGKIIAGTGTANFSGDGGAATSATLNNPGDLALDSKGNLYIADRGNGRVRQVSPSGVIQTVAGAYLGFSYSDISGQLAKSVSLGAIEGLAIDAKDQLYISEPSRVSLIASDGRIYVIAGFRSQNDAGVVTYENGPLYGLNGLAIDNLGRLYLSVDQSGQVKMALPPGDPGPAPIITGAISAAAFGGLTAAATGSFVEIYGGNLATTARSWSSSDFNDGHAPTSLSETSVAIAGQKAFVSFISPDQVNVQVPSAVPLGSQSIVVSTAAGNSSSHTIDIKSTAPGLLAPAQFLIDGKQYLGALFPDAKTWVLPSGVAGVSSRPAKAGDNIVLYGIGFGAVTPAMNAGQLVEQKNQLNLSFQISFDHVPATVTYAGLVQGEVGLYQFSVVVPSGVTGDAVPVSFTLGGVAGAQTLYTAIEN